MWINSNLYKSLGSIANPCAMEAWLGPLKSVGNGKVGNISKARLKIRGIEGLLEHYIVKTQPNTSFGDTEKLVMKILAKGMLKGDIPEIFSFLYMNFVCNETLYFIMQPFEITLGDTLRKYPRPSIEWWSSVLYQISQAIFHLEELEINHNDLTLENIMLQEYTENPEDVRVVIIDFGSAVIRRSQRRGLPDFTLGRDLNYFLYVLLNDGVSNGYFPRELGDKIFPFISWRGVSHKKDEDQYTTGLRRTNITKSNWRSSGKHISEWLMRFCPVPDCFTGIKKKDKIMGICIGSMIGDALGMPIQQDYSNSKKITGYHGSDEFNGSLNHLNLKPGTWTDETQQNILFMETIIECGGHVNIDIFKRNLLIWKNNDPIDITRHMNKVLTSEFKDLGEPKFSDNGAVARAWLSAVLPGDPNITSMNNAKITHSNSDSIYAAIFICLLIRYILEGNDFNKARRKATLVVKEHISLKLYSAIKEGDLINYSKLDGGIGSVIDTIKVVMWSIANTNTFEDAVLAAINVPGMSDCNGCVTGAVAGAIYGLDGIPDKLMLKESQIGIVSRFSELIMKL